MKAYFFHEGVIPSGYQQDFEESLFNHQDHRALQSVEGWCSFYVLNSKSKKIKAALHFHITGTLARSPLRAPFGSIEFSNSLPAEILFKFLIFTETALKNKGIKQIIIKNYPQAYHEYTTLIQTFLLNLRYEISHAEVSSVIKITKKNAADIFHRSERRKVNKALQAGLSFCNMPISEFDRIYTFIQNCRSDKNYLLSMSIEALRLALNQFPANYLLFGVFHGNELVAASISILVKKNILYDFYHDHESSYNHLSPIALLIAEMYNYCKQNNIKLLDMGTSSVDGAPNFSLLHFKKFLGGRPVSKFTFEKKLN